MTQNDVNVLSALTLLPVLSLPAGRTFYPSPTKKFMCDVGMFVYAKSARMLHFENLKLRNVCAKSNVKQPFDPTSSVRLWLEYVEALNQALTLEMTLSLG